MMSWRRVRGVGGTAVLLASLLCAAAASPASAACVVSQGTYFPWCANATTAPADGLSYIDIAFGASSGTSVTALEISVSGGFFLGGTGAFTPSASLTYPRTVVSLASATNVTLASGDDLWLASTTSGNAVFSVMYTGSSGPHYDSVYAFSFTTPVTGTVSTVYSYTATVTAATATSLSPTPETSYPAGGGADSGAVALTAVRDTNNASIVAGATVTWTLSGPGVFPGNLTSASAPATGSQGVAISPDLVSTGVPGDVTIATTVTYLSVAYTLPAVTFTFTGTTSAVPTQRNQCYKGGWKGLVDGHGHAFKNQGDCVSFVATGGKNLGSVTS